MDKVDMFFQPFGFYAGVPAWCRTLTLFLCWLALVLGGMAVVVRGLAWILRTTEATVRRQMPGRAARLWTRR